MGDGVTNTSTKMQEATISKLPTAIITNDQDDWDLIIDATPITCVVTTTPKKSAKFLILFKKVRRFVRHGLPVSRIRQSLKSIQICAGVSQVSPADSSVFLPVLSLSIISRFCLFVAKQVSQQFSHLYFHYLIFSRSWYINKWRESLMQLISSHSQ